MSGVPRQAVVRALDALGDGDQAEAALVLLDAFEDYRGGLGPPPCPVCGARAWPGDESRHVWSLHYSKRRAA
jgi:hypothetical protein